MRWGFGFSCAPVVCGCPRVAVGLFLHILFLWSCPAGMLSTDRSSCCGCYGSVRGVCHLAVMTFSLFVHPFLVASLLLTLWGRFCGEGSSGAAVGSVVPAVLLSELVLFWCLVDGYLGVEALLVLFGLCILSLCPVILGNLLSCAFISLFSDYSLFSLLDAFPHVRSLSSAGFFSGFSACVEVWQLHSLVWIPYAFSGIC